MRIGVVADPCDPKTPGGLGRAIYEWARAFIAIDDKDEIVVYAKDPSAFVGPNVTHKTLPKQVWTRGASALDPSLDLYIFFTPVIPLLFRPKRAIVIAGDFAYLDLPQKGLKEHVWAYASFLMHRRSLRMATVIPCFSEATKESAVKHFGVVAQKCTVIPLAAMPLAAPIPVNNLPDKFFFFAGALKDRKNIANLIRAFALYRRGGGDATFLIAGKTGGNYYDSLVELVRQEGVSDHVKFLGYVKDGEVTYLYSKALALVFASLVEGFGMPVLEAMGDGLPVITADRGAVAEITGSAALLADPHSPESIAHQMTRVARDGELRADLVTRGKVQAAKYTWDASAKKLLEVVSST